MHKTWCRWHITSIWAIFWPPLPFLVMKSFFEILLLNLHQLICTYFCSSIAEIRKKEFVSIISFALIVICIGRISNFQNLLSCYVHFVPSQPHHDENLHEIVATTASNLAHGWLWYWVNKLSSISWQKTRQAKRWSTYWGAHIRFPENDLNF